MQLRSTVTAVKKLFGHSLKPINKLTIPVIVKVVTNVKKQGFWMQYWTYEEIIKGEKQDKQGNKLKFFRYYND